MRSHLFGDVARELGLVSDAQIRKALEVQARVVPRLPLGRILRDQGILEQAGVDRILVEQQRRRVDEDPWLVTRTAEALVVDVLRLAGRIDESRLRRAMAACREDGITLKQALNRLSFLRVDTFQKALDQDCALAYVCPACLSQFQFPRQEAVSNVCRKCGAVLMHVEDALRGPGEEREVDRLRPEPTATESRSPGVVQASGRQRAVVLPDQPTAGAGASTAGMPSLRGGAGVSGADIGSRPGRAVVPATPPPAPDGAALPERVAPPDRVPASAAAPAPVPAPSPAPGAPSSPSSFPTPPAPAVPPAARRGLPLRALSAIAAVLLLAVAAVFLLPGRGNGGADRTPDQPPLAQKPALVPLSPRERAALTAWEQVLAFRKRSPEDRGSLVRMIEDALRRYPEASWTGEAENLKQELQRVEAAKAREERARELKLRELFEQADRELAAFRFQGVLRLLETAAVDAELGAFAGRIAARRERAETAAWFWERLRGQLEHGDAVLAGGVHAKVDKVYPGRIVVFGSDKELAPADLDFAWLADLAGGGRSGHETLGVFFLAVGDKGLAERAFLIAAPKPAGGVQDTGLLDQVHEGMAYVPAGPFLYGNDKEEVLVAAFYIDREEVTNEDYGRFLEFIRDTGNHAFCHPGEGANKDHTPRYRNDPLWNFPRQPVVGVDWFDAHAYSAWKKGRLPTEEEWERAARGTDGRPYPWGSAFVEERANTLETRWRSTAPVGSFPAGVSPAGCLDMAGNVKEWCLPESEDQDLASETPAEVFVRGGSWAERSIEQRVTRRWKFSPTSRNSSTGFRVVRSAYLLKGPQ